MWYQSIRFKLIAFVGAVTFLAIGVYSYVNVNSQRAQVLHEMTRNVHLVGEVIRRSLRFDMLEYRPERLHKAIDTIAAQEGIEKVRIFNALGEIIYSSDKNEMGSMVDKSAEQCYACHAKEKPFERLTTSDRTRIFSAKGGYRVLGMINPIYNEPDCSTAECHIHPVSQKILGVLDIDIGLQELDELIKQSEKQMMLFALIAICSVSGIIALLIQRFVTRPVRRLVEGTERVARGDLESPIEISSEDEIGLLARSFDEMRIKLRDHTTNLESLLKECTYEVRKRQDFEHRLIQTSMDGIIANDRTGKIITFSEGACRIYGYTRDEATSDICVHQLYAPGEARAIKKRIYGTEFGGPGRLINYETRALTKDGRLVPILLSATVICEDDIEVATVGYFKDLTEIKRLEEELVQTARLAAIGQAMAEVAHGVKNILYGMKLGAFMVSKGLAKPDLGTVHRGWQIVEKSIDRISRLSLDMLNYARKGSLHGSSVSLNQLASEVCDSLMGRAESKHVRIDRDLMSDLPFVSGDAEALHTCILNLVTNAVEAIPENAPDARVLVRTGLDQDGGVILQVTDTGKGMSPELQKEIFKPLFSTKGARGTGLGLSITKKIVEEHGGSIHVRSESRLGSIFTIHIPSWNGALTDE